MKKLIVLSAPSGAGKTTLCHRILKDFPEITLSISCTTRPPRGKERHGKEYFFLSAEDFKRQIAEGSFAEWAEVHGNYYGTSKEFIENSIQKGRIVLLDIDVQGAASLRNTYRDRCFTIFVTPPDLSTLEARLRARGTDSEETIQRRLKNAAGEMSAAKDFDKVILNDDLERAYRELKSVIESQIRPTDKDGSA